MVFNLPFAEVKDIAKQGGIVFCSVFPELEHMRMSMTSLDSTETNLPVHVRADWTLAALKRCPG